jgi:hypothetical protein
MDPDATILFVFWDLVQVIKAIFSDVFEIAIREVGIVYGISGVSSVENKCLTRQSLG